MRIINFFKAVLLLASLAIVVAHPQRQKSSGKTRNHKSKSEIIRLNRQDVIAGRGPPVRTRNRKVGSITVLTNTTAGDAVATGDTAARVAIAAAVGTSVQSTVLVLARDTASAYSAWSGLKGYAIPYQVVLVPQAGVTLPTLYSGTTGNYGAIVILSEVSYDYGGATGFASALTTAQWTSLYQYQTDFGVRMVRLDVFPGPAFGATALGGCCNTGVEQLISISSNTQFPTSGLKT